MKTAAINSQASTAMSAALSPQESIARLRAAAARLGRHANFMEVCGTHTVSVFRSGLHSLMPDNVTLLSGPGCPVCVTSQGDIDQLVELALRKDVTLCTYGDMIRVTGATGSLEGARGQGADVRVLYSALDAVKIAIAEPRRQVVFAAVGFETTTPATAAAILEADRLFLGNFTALTSHKVIMPAMRALLEGGSSTGKLINVDGFLCPGHVAVILGAAAFRPVVENYGKACVIAGFEPEQIAAAMALLVEMVADGKPVLANAYPQAVSEEGNTVAWGLVQKVFEPCPSYWRGLGVLPDSGLGLRAPYTRYDARIRFELGTPGNREPAGCRCGDVITGRATPAECRLFGNVCTPIRAIGPCMVSSEGTCQAWFKYQRVSKEGKP